MAKQKTKLPIKRYLIYILIAVVLISNTTFSRYVSTSTGGSSVTVALFASDVVVDVPITKIAPGETITFDIEIRNYEDDRVSEVSQRYQITHELMSEKLAFDVSYDTQWNDMRLADAGNDGKITHTQTVTVSWDGANNDYTLADEIQVIRFKVDAQQID